ncbi:MAG: PAS domain-containing protein, partial [Myxococcales bacterium]
EQRFRLMVSGVKDYASFMLDPEGRVASWNAGAERLLGYGEDEALGMDFEAFFPEADRAEGRHRRELERAAKDGTAYDVGRRMRRDGSSFWADVTVTAVRDDAGRLLGFAKVVKDVTEQRRAEAALREREELFRTLADNIAQLAWMAHPDGDIFWYSRRWFDYTGTTLEEVKGWGWRKVHHPEHVARVADKLRWHIEHGEPWEDTFPLRGRDGQYRWFLSRAVPIRDEHGQVVRWFGTNTDVSEWREAQLQLERKKAQLDRALEAERAAREKAEETLALLHTFAGSTALGFAYVDQDLRYVIVNPALAAMNGLPLEAHAGRPVRDVVRGAAGDLVEGRLRKVLETGEPLLDLEAAIPCPGDPQRMCHFLSSFHPIRRGDGSVQGVGVIVADVTHQRAAEREATQRAAFAQELIAIVSHDLRSPISAILLSAGTLLRRANLDERQRSALERIVSSATRATRMISDLLDFTRAQVGSGIPLSR